MGKDHLNIIYNNAHSLNNKIDDLKKIFLSAIDIDILAVTETWFKDDTSPSEILSNNSIFRFYFAHRNLAVTDKATGGGCMLVINDQNCSSSLIYSHSGHYEAIYVKVNKRGKKFLLALAYIPPNSDVQQYQDFCFKLEELAESLPDHSPIIIGDLNIPNVNWSVNDKSEISLDTSNCKNKNVSLSAKELESTMSNLGLTQHHPELISKGYTLDLVFGEPEVLSCEEFADPLYKTDKNHITSHIKVNLLSPEHVNQTLMTQYDYKNADITAINNCLKEINWGSLLHNTEDICNLNNKDKNIQILDTNVKTFYSEIHKIFENHIPKRKQYVGSFPRWYSDDLKALIIEKKKAHRTWKISNNLTDHIQFKKLRAKCIKLSKENFSSFIQETEALILTNTRNFWSYVNSMRKCKNSIPKSMKYKAKSSSNDKDTADLFADHFSSVYNKSQTPSVTPNTPDQTLDQLHISAGDLLNIINDMDDKMNIGPDLIPAFILKRTTSAISPPILKILQQSLLIGYMPYELKKSFITPVFKSGNENDISNYRPITILNTISKIIDKFVASKISDFALGKLAQEQHGFIKGRSTETNLLVFCDKIFQSLKSSDQTDAIYTDFSKAFDTVDHTRLLSKIGNFGVRGTILDWLQSYLTDRTQKVRVRDQFSYSFTSTSGVPQGSNLGPILFIIFVNDVTEVIKHSAVLMYADDLKIFKVIKTKHDAELLQMDIKSFKRWSEENGLKLNESKCSCITFSKKNPFVIDYKIGDQFLSRKNEVKDLGIWFDSKLTFDRHIDFVTKTVAKTVGFIIRNCKDFKNIQTLVNIYKTLVIPIFTYGSTVWFPSTQCRLKRLESAQHRFLRFLSKRTDSPMHFFSHDYSQISRRTDICTVESLLLGRDKMVMWKIMHNSFSSSDLRAGFLDSSQRIVTRNQPPLHRIANTVSYICNSPIPRLTVAWNSTPSNTRNVNEYHIFRKIIKLCTNVPYSEI